MDYPTLEEVERADRVQICRWWRHLPPPGVAAIEAGACHRRIRLARAREAEVMARIAARFADLGGFNPDISKQVGWKQ